MRGASGERASRPPTSFLSAGDAILLEEQGSTSTAVYTYGSALLRKDGEYPLYDGLGSARAGTNGSQTVTATLIPDAFGQTVASTGSTASAYGFAATSGYRSDGDAGLMHVGARYYDPQVGRFTSRDTVLSEHPYLYCEHDPVSYVDPSGRTFADSVVSLGLGIATVGGAIMGIGWVIPALAPATEPGGGFIAGVGGLVLVGGVILKGGELALGWVGGWIGRMGRRWKLPHREEPIHVVVPREGPGQPASPWGCGAPPPGVIVERPYMGPY